MMRYLLVMIAVLTLASAPAFGAVDDEYTVSLLHFDGGFTDESGKTWTGFGNATTTTPAKIGTQALYLDGSEDFLQTASNIADFNFPGDFTIDFWIKTTINTQYTNILALIKDSPYEYWLLWFDDTSGAPGITYLSSNSNVVKSGTAINNGVWHHLAIARESSTVRCFVDGTQTATSTYSGALSSWDSNVFKIGYQIAAAPRYFQGYIDELRISKGIARWKDNFTPQTTPYGQPVPPAPPSSLTPGAFRIGAEGTLFIH